MPQYLLVYVRLLRSVDGPTRIVSSIEVRKSAVGAADDRVYACEEQGGAIKFSRCVPKRFGVRRVNFMVKLLRAHGGCLGRRRRRKTWQAAISFGERQTRIDPEIS